MNKTPARKTVKLYRVYGPTSPPRPQMFLIEAEETPKSYLVKPSSVTDYRTRINKDEAEREGYFPIHAAALESARTAAREKIASLEAELRDAREWLAQVEALGGPTTPEALDEEQRREIAARILARTHEKG
jgi:hypothetical protein